VISHLKVCEEKLDAKLSEVPRIALSDIKVDSLIGKGSFSKVFKVQVRGRTCDDFDEVEKTSSHSREAAQEIVRRFSGGSNCSTKQHSKNFYALKCLNAKRMTSEGALVMATLDLSYEASILAELDHENIIRLEGVASEAFCNSFFDGKSGYYILLEMLKETLECRLQRWRTNFSRRFSSAGNAQKPTSTRLRRQQPSSTTAEILALLEYQNRVPDTILGVAKAMWYLHKRNILLRDLKPANIGFTKRGTVKIFDLGFARREDDCQAEELAGSYRYMSPEHMMGAKSSLSSDVYSFALVFFEVLTLEKPYNEIIAGSSGASPADSVRSDLRRKLSLKCDGGEEWRHSVEDIPCSKTRQLIRRCWSPDPGDRPDFEHICVKVEEICHDWSILCCQDHEEHEVAPTSKHERKSASPLSRRLSRTFSGSHLLAKRRGSAPAILFPRRGSVKGSGSTSPGRRFTRVFVSEDGTGRTSSIQSREESFCSIQE